MDGMKKCNFPTTYNVNFVESLKVTFTLAVWGDTFLYYSYTTDTNTMLQNCFKCGNLSKKILARIIWSWQCCRLLVGNIANGIASKNSFAFLTELRDFKQNFF